MTMKNDQHSYTLRDSTIKWRWKYITDENSTSKETKIEFCSGVENCDLGQQHVKVLGVNTNRNISPFTNNDLQHPIEQAGVLAVEFNAPPDTILVISEAVFAANHLTDTDWTKQYRKIHKLNITQKGNKIKCSKNITILVQSPLMTLCQETRKRGGLILHCCPVWAQEHCRL